VISTADEPDVVLLIIRPRHVRDRSPAGRRLRRALKMMRVAYALPCTHVEELHPSDLAGVLGAATVLRRRRRDPPARRERRAGRSTPARRPSDFYRPHTGGQRQFHQAPHIVRCLFPGNGFGKTTAAGNEVNWWVTTATRGRRSRPAR
jgi:hypothetical protein